MLMRLVAAAVVAAAVVTMPPRSRSPPRMLPRPRPLLFAARAPPPRTRQGRGGGRLLVKLALDNMEQWGSRVSKVIWGGTHIVGETRILLAK
jgi:hypothetical protein